MMIFYLEAIPSVGSLSRPLWWLVHLSCTGDLLKGGFLAFCCYLLLPLQVKLGLIDDMGNLPSPILHLVGGNKFGFSVFQLKTL